MGVQRAPIIILPPKGKGFMKPANVFFQEGPSYSGPFLQAHRQDCCHGPWDGQHGSSRAVEGSTMSRPMQGQL